jgi:hypothetical protein
VRRRSAWVAWFILAVFAVSLVALGALSVANGSFPQEPLADTLALLLAFTVFMVVGALIVAHRPGNAIGWLFSASPLLAVTGAQAAEYAVYAFLTRPGWLPGAIVLVPDAGQAAGPAALADPEGCVNRFMQLANTRGAGHRARLVDERCLLGPRQRASVRLDPAP